MGDGVVGRRVSLGEEIWIGEGEYGSGNDISRSNSVQKNKKFKENLILDFSMIFLKNQTKDWKIGFLISSFALQQNFQNY